MPPSVLIRNTARKPRRRSPKRDGTRPNKLFNSARTTSPNASRITLQSWQLSLKPKSLTGKNPCEYHAIRIDVNFKLFF